MSGESFSHDPSKADFLVYPADEPHLMFQVYMTYRMLFAGQIGYPSNDCGVGWFTKPDMFMI